MCYTRWGDTTNIQHLLASKVPPSLNTGVHPRHIRMQVSKAPKATVKMMAGRKGI